MTRLLFLRLILLFCAPLCSFSLQAQQKDPNELYAVIDSSRGRMEFLLYRQVAPLTVSNFVNLATRGFYDGLTFHRVEPDFMAQGGDPDGDGSGGPGYKFDDEIALRLNQEGILAMANSGPASNGSQFFITHQATPHLNGAHTVFGLVISGKEVIRQIRVGDTIQSITIEGNVKALLQRNSDQVYRWNQILDENFPQLKPPLVE
ncbi:MAG: peptidylprolyl isomerase [Pseudohongiellaceae bacterium]|jgi:peptidyl-prolyl cis-trans isomerase B (cyclophilin B)